MNSTSEIIRSLESRLINAARANDADTIVALLHDDLRFVLPGGQIITKKMEHEAYTQGLMSVKTLLSEEPEIVLHPDTAVVTVKVKLIGSYQEQPIEGDFLYLRIWKQTAGNWQVIAGSCTPLLP